MGVKGFLLDASNVAPEDCLGFMASLVFGLFFLGFHAHERLNMLILAGAILVVPAALGGLVGREASSGFTLAPGFADLAGTTASKSVGMSGEILVCVSAPSWRRREGRGEDRG